MLFVKEIRQHVRPAYGPQDWEPPTADGAIHLGLMDTRARPQCDALADLEEGNFPHEVMLRAYIEPICFEGQGIPLSFAIDGTHYPALDFYGKQLLMAKQRGVLKDAHVAQVHLRPTGEGLLYMEGSHKCLGHTPHALVVDDQKLMTKTFMHQKGRALFERRTYGSRKRWITTPAYGRGACPSAVCLMPYGGYVKEGRGVDSIDQMFASLEEMDTGVWRLMVRSLQELRANNVVPPLGGLFHHTQYVFLDSFESEDLLGFAAMIDGGHARASLRLGEGVSQPYRSWRYVQNDPGSGVIDVYFKKTADEER